MTLSRVIIVSLLLGSAVIAQKVEPLEVNLLSNASFEDLDADGNPRGWHTETWSGKPRFAVEEGFARTGKRCVKIHATEGADGSWSMSIPVRPRTRYRLEAWVKTKDLDRRSGRGAQLNLHQLQYDGRTDAIHGTNDWTLISGEFESGAHRVQRVPETESQGRIHTSACTVAG